MGELRNNEERYDLIERTLRRFCSFGGLLGSKTGAGWRAVVLMESWFEPSGFDFDVDASGAADKTAPTAPVSMLPTVSPDS
jgi:hypothetical protein